MHAKRRRLLVMVVLSLLVASGTVAVGAGAEGADAPPPDQLPSLVEVTVPDRAAVERLQTRYDLAEYTRGNSDGTITINVEATPGEVDELRADGYEIGATIEDTANWEERNAERDAAIAAEERAQALAEDGVSARVTFRVRRAMDTVTMARADYFTNYAGAFLSVEAKGSNGSGTSMAVSYDTGSGFGAAQNMSAFVDDGVYLYHRTLVRIGPAGYSGPVPVTARVGSGAGGVGTLPVKTWAGSSLPPHAAGYLEDFVGHYLDPQEAYARINDLHAAFPEITDVVDLPYLSNGYRRKSMAVLDSNSNILSTPGSTARAVYVESNAWGTEGGNAVQIELLNPGGANQPLSVSVTGNLISVGLATGSTGAITSTAAQVAAAVDASPSAAALATAYTYAGSAGGTAVLAHARVTLTDGLAAPASVARAPFRLQALRIGAHRDGSKIGVFVYCEQHAREWVTPDVCVETAERLVRNYATDPETKQFVDNLDVFIVPVFNPDGSNYSHYDSGSQRKNMTRYCPLTATSGMPTNRTAWGVDNNRNNSVGSVYDGYDGASTSCTNDVYAGPSELSEPENRNEAWLVDTYTNIRFSMNVHTYGGYFMWAPGAYVLSGRVTLPHPNIGVEGYFFSASDTILSRIKEYRDTAVLPARTGPVADVLYSAAGNSSDDEYYRRGILAWDFEAGSDRFTSTSTGTSQTAVGFQPSFASEGHAEGMEFANGNFGLLEEALEYANDTTPPDARMMPGGGVSTSPIVSTFDWVNEPATIHYTLDGSTPTLASPTWNAQAPNLGRLPGELFSFTAPKTTIEWIAQDIRGNVSPVGSATFYVDTTAPVTTASFSQPERNGWYTGPTVTLAAGDGPDGSGVVSTEYRLDGGAFQAYTAPFAVTAEGPHTLEFRSTDAAGNVEALQSRPFQVDGTDPTISVTTPAEDARYLLGASVLADYACVDALSGLESCAGTVPSGSPLDTVAVGPHAFRVDARDVAGNTASRSVAYLVVWPFTGFFAPVNSPPTVNVAQGGSAVPVKFSLGADRGLAILADGYPRSAKVPCSPGAGDPLEQTVAAGQSSLAFDGAQYVYVWKTEKAWAGTCRELVVRLADGSEHRAQFRFR